MLNYRLATRPIGGTTKLVIRRDGKSYTATVALQAAPESPLRDATTIVGGSPFAGITVLNLSPAVAEELLYSGNVASGVIINEVKPNSAAANVGFRRNDVILEVNGAKIDTTQRLAALAQQQASSWALTIRRGDQTIRQTFR
jgi:S1-C subfamily serine protease